MVFDPIGSRITGEGAPETRLIAVRRTIRTSHAERTPVNISRTEQRVLHVLAQGGRIRHHRDGGRIVAVDCIDRDGNRLVDCDLATFARLRRRGLIASRGGAPYVVSEAGRRAVRSQLDNR